MWLSSGFYDSRMGKIQPKIPKMRIYDLPGGVIMTPPLDASMAFYPLDLQGLINLHNENDNRITINYIPSHIGIHGNDLADTAAKEALSKIEIDHIIKPEFKALKNKIIKYLIKKNCISNLPPHSITDSILHYHLATESIPEVKTKNRQLEVNIIRLRLGYKTYSQLTGKQTVCSRCLRILNKPLVHYLSGCQSLYPYYNNIIEQADTAANNLNLILKNEQILHDLIIKYPPPR